jgi:hypothetical protein
MGRICFMILLLSNTAVAQKNINKTDPCYLLKRPLDCAIIEHNARKILVGQDDCVLALIDSVYSNLTRTKGVNFLIALDSIAKNSDGYVSDYLMEIGVKLFYQDLSLVANYLCKRRTSSPAIERLIIESMSSYLSGTKERDKKQQKIIEFVDREKKEQKIDHDSYAYIMHLVKQFDPKMFD